MPKSNSTEDGFCFKSAVPPNTKSLAFLGFPDYRVSDDGRVFSRKIRGSHSGGLGPWKPMKLTKEHNGYIIVNLYRKINKPETWPVHRLVALAFIGPRPKGLIVRHLDDVRKNNNVKNLSYGTKIDNYADSIRNGGASIGEDRYNAKLTNDQVREIRRLGEDRFTRYHEIAEKFGVRAHYIGRILRREIWRHVS